MCWYLNYMRSADIMVNLLWSFSWSPVGTIIIIYFLTVKWLGYTRVPNGRVCDWVPIALQCCPPTVWLSSRARDLFSDRPLRQRGESWSPAVGSGLLQGTWQVSDRSGNGARSLSFLVNLVSPIIWCSATEPGKHCVQNWYWSCYAVCLKLMP